MDFALTPEQQRLQAAARAFVEQELMPLEGRLAQADAAGGRFPDDDTLALLKSRARERGLWGLQTPAAFGGMGLSAVSATLIAMETGRSFTPFDYGGFATHMLFAGTPEQQARYLVPVLNDERHFCLAMSEPGAGSDATAIRTTARRDGDDWVINGAKSWISFGHMADFAIVLARTDAGADGPAGVTAFLVDRDRGWTSRPTPTMLGAFHQAVFNEAPPAELTFDQVRTPSDSVLGEPGGGLKLAMAAIGGGGRLRVPAYAVGHGERLMQMAIERLRDLRDGGHSTDGFEHSLAHCAARLQGVRWLVLNAAWRADRGDARQAVSMAKLAGPALIWDILDAVIQMLGPEALLRHGPVERLYRQARVYRIFAGSDEMQRRSIAAGLRKHPSRISAFD